VGSDVSEASSATTPWSEGRLQGRLRGDPVIGGLDCEGVKAAVRILVAARFVAVLLFEASRKGTERKG